MTAALDFHCSCENKLRLILYKHHPNIIGPTQGSTPDGKPGYAMHVAQNEGNMTHGFTNIKCKVLWTKSTGSTLNEILPGRGDRCEDTGRGVLRLAFLMLTEPTNAKAITIQIAICLQPDQISWKATMLDLS